jgi:hypothetical protein
MRKKLTRNPPILYDQSMDKKLLIEKIETKIEEFKESATDGMDLMVIEGLKIALDIINE